MKYRPQRGGYEESMAACVTLEPTYEALAEYLGTTPEAIDVSFYHYDTRGWGDTYLVMIDDDVVGFTDGGLGGVYV